MLYMKKGRNLRHNVRQVKAALLESDVQVYAMGLFEGEESELTREERRGGCSGGARRKRRIRASAETRRGSHPGGRA
jgi:hypothetical protein